MTDPAPPYPGPHFFIDPADVDGDGARLTGEQGRHLATVLRARPGQQVSLADGTGRRYAARVRRAQDDTVLLAVEHSEEEAPSQPSLTVVHALPKGRKLDEVVQRLSEVGVDRLVPVVSARTETTFTPDKAARAVARWRAVALAAAKQSRRARVLEVAEVGVWSTELAAAPGAGVVCWEGAMTRLREVLPRDADALVLGIGPEGGLTAGEVEATGLPAATLGPTVLRTETAALVAVTAVLTLVGRLA